jgi:alcohol dehydrogenase
LASKDKQELKPFQVVAPFQRIVFGPGTVDTAGQEVDQLGCRRVFLVTGPNTSRTPAYDRVRRALGARCVGEFTGVRPHSLIPDTERVAVEASALGIDLLVSVGGGSASDSAKGIAILLAEGRTLADHCDLFTPPNCLVHRDLQRPKVPLIAVPTTASGAEMTPGCGATAPDGIKLKFWDHKLAARVVLLDPEATADVPLAITISTSMNGFAHCVEGLYSLGKNPFTDALAIQAVRLFADALPRLVVDPTSQPVRGKIQVAAALGGMVISNARTALHHTLCHALGGRFRVSHGNANAVMLPHAMRFNLDVTAPEQAQIAWAMGAADRPDETAAARAADAVASFARRIGAPGRLRDLGVPRDQLPAAAKDVLHDRGLYFNPKPIASAEPILAIYEAAW